MKIYTKTGDTGETGLLGGRRVAKTASVIEAIGAVDELNAALGVLAAEIPASADGVEVVARVQGVQHCLFNLGAMLAAVNTTLVAVPVLTDAHIADLEAWIDEMETALPPLTQFILPAGTRAAAQSFWVRAVCRRAERRVVALAAEVPLHPNVLEYLNRLSDALFVCGRWLNARAGADEVRWVR